MVENMNGLYNILAMHQEELKIFVFDLPCTWMVDEIPRKPGIYFLVENETFVYIGKSNNVRRRWLAQRRRYGELGLSKKLYFLTGYDFHLETIEAIFILILKPLYNRSINFKLSWEHINKT